MIIMLFIAPYTAYLPIPAMAGIIVLVAYNLVDFHHIKKILKASKAEFTVLVATFVSTLFLQLEFAIYFGVFLSLAFYLQRTSSPLLFRIAPDPANVKRKFFRVDRKQLTECPQLMIIRLDGSLFYGAVPHVAKELARLSKEPEQNILLIANGVNIIDVSGAELLVNESKRWSSIGKRLYISGLKKGAREFLKKGGYWDEIGAEYFCTNKQEAIAAIFQKLDHSQCLTCEARIFQECRSIPAKERN
jgi:SulP family sulfate permease